MSKLAIHGGPKTIEPSEARYVWPRITESVERAVLQQLRTSVSIYDGSGVFGEFERRFASMHGRDHGLLFNSGTSAIMAMFESLNLQPGDEVLAPTYTFFATVSPLAYIGFTPVFCDCDESGNIDPVEISKRATSRTRALIVTHMWGIPCDMDPIVSVCKEHNLRLLEDCSHAHGARYKDKLVGTFGDAAAWSLQGQKNITGGEGGILLTNDTDLLGRAVLLGHYNKRCLQLLPQEHPLRDFALTGFGLKLRAHPLGIALANEQLNHLAEWHATRSVRAEQFADRISSYPFLLPPRYNDKQPSWYAFVMQFDQNRANGVSIGQFVAALHAEGLVEVDRPGSTCPVHDLPLFREPQRALSKLGHHARSTSNSDSYPAATRFFENAIKIPVWAFPEDELVFERYIEGFQKVCEVVETHPDLVRTIRA